LPLFGLWLLANVMFAFVCFTAFGHVAKAVKQTKANITMAKSRKTNKGKHHNGQKP
jgi:hypothetical protein